MKKILAAALMLLTLAGWAWAERPEIELTAAGRVSLRSKDGVPSELLSRIDVLLLPNHPHWMFTPFVETRYSFDDSDFSRVELGAEAGVKPFSWWQEELEANWYTKPLTWFYFGQAVYQRWLKPEISQTPAKSAETLEHIFPGATHTEWESRFLFDIPIPWAIKSHPLGLYALDEYIVDLNQGRTIRNEIAAGVKIPLVEKHSVGLFIGWRHVDLVHLNDTDQFETGIRAKF